MTEIKKRSWRGFYIALVCSFIIGMAGTFISTRNACDISNPLKAYQCPSEGTQFVFSLLGGLIDLVIIGLPFGYLLYNDIKWKLLGYKPAAKGIVTDVLLVTTGVIVFLSAYVEMPAWLGVVLLLSLYAWLIFSTVYYHALKQQYEDDKNNGKLPKLGITEVLEKERKLDEELSKNNKNSQPEDEFDPDDTFDDGL